ncbi:hypothetical protein RAH57_13860 [Chryseobacterium sp. CKR4-1]|uniref:hypothetical protein n=1 Tax=Chryseobacterium sp. CKR4-1 TaxID=3068896 RepID=UPI002796B13F|nr:hypothetical protein [Chryseobacterium sp. CKR4-1]MDQ1805079.1 hypothetical protein [Chryseobacterium sp. CKR4-1]
MLDTIGQHEEHFSKQVFRITFKTCDFQIVLLQKKLTKDQQEFQVLLDGLVQKLIKKSGKWYFNHGEDQDHAADIWRQIALRYRL